jgi:hypothetical protein
MAVSSSAPQQLHVRLSLAPAARAELERIAEQDRRSLASAASLLLEATLRARQGGEVSEAVNG